MTKEKRSEVIDLVKRGWSYQLAADQLALTRNQVAGIMFRHKHPYHTLVSSPGSKTRNKTGTGRHGPGKMPKYDARYFAVSL